MTEAESDWHRYVSATKRHKWIVLLVTVLGTALGWAAASRLDLRYAAKAILWIESANRDPTVGAISDQKVVEPEGWAELATSRTVLDSVVRALRLYLTPDRKSDLWLFDSMNGSNGIRPGRYQLSVDQRGETMRLTNEEGAVMEERRVGQPIGEALGVSWLPPAAALTPGRKIEFTLLTPDDAVVDLTKALSVRLDLGGNFLTLQLRTTDPTRAAAIVNAVAHRTVAVAADLKRRKFEELDRILTEQDAQAKGTLESAEAALTAFRTRTSDLLRAGVPAPLAAGDTRGDPAMGTAFELRFELDKVRRERQELEALVKTARDSALRIETVTGLGLVERSPNLAAAFDELTKKHAELRALRHRYTSASAPVTELEKQVKALEQRVVPEIVAQMAADLATREASLAPRVDSAFGYLKRMPPVAMQQARLERDLRTAEELYTTVRQRREATRLALASSLPDLRVLDQAGQGRRPVNDFGPLVVVLSLLISFVVGVVGVTLLDRGDSKIRRPEQVTQELRLPILSAIPHIGWSEGRNGLASGEVIESVRSLRVRIANPAVRNDIPTAITVTSPSPREGKSFVTVNLALSFAYAGYRTLLIDGDVRRGAQHRALRLSRRPGLTDVLTGAVSPEEALQATEYANLTFLAAGVRMHRAPELLLSGRLREVIEGLRSRFDVIVVDSPPLTAGIDPVVLGNATGQLLLVMRSGATDLPLALSKLDLINSLPVETLGVVLNDVRGNDPFRHYAYDLSEYGRIEADADDAERPLKILGGRPG